MQHGGGAADSKPEKRSRGRPALVVRMQPFDEVSQAWHRERPDLDLENMLLALAIIRMNRLVDLTFESALKTFGVSVSEMRVLLALRRMGPPYARRPTDLYRALVVTSGTITKQVNSLVNKGLVVRARDPLHAGGYLIHLASQGLKVANAIAENQSSEAVLASAMAKLTREERQQGIRFVEHLLRDLEESYLA